MGQFQDYLIAVKTGDLSYAQTDGTPEITLHGLFGKCSPYLLTHSSSIALKKNVVDKNNNIIIPETDTHERWCQNSWDIFHIRTFDLGSIRKLNIDKQGTNAWYLEKIIVIPFFYNTNYEHSNISNVNILDISNRRTFIIKRWFDSADFDKLTSLWVHPDELLKNSKLNFSELRDLKIFKTAKTKIMRYDNSQGTDPIETDFTYSYSVLKGVAIEKEKTTQISSGYNISSDISFSYEAGGFEASASVSTSFSKEITDTCMNKFGTTTTTSEEQTQTIPITIPKESNLTIIFQIYENSLKYKVSYDGYEVPITVNDGTIDTSFKVFNKILSKEEAEEEIQNLMTISGAVFMSDYSS
jgi:hypothetical protein